MRRQRGVDLTSPPLSSGLARRVAAPEVTASAGAGGLAQYRCPWSWVVFGTGAAGGSGGPGVTRRGGAGGSVLGRLAWRENRVAPGKPLRAASSTPLTMGALRLAYPKRLWGPPGLQRAQQGPWRLPTRSSAHLLRPRYLPPRPTSLS